MRRRPSLKKLASASRQLAELKGAAGTIPQQRILINTLSIQEAKDSSEVGNIVTTHAELFQDDLSLESTLGPAAREVLRYPQALWTGFEGVRQSSLLTNNHILEIQAAPATWKNSSPAAFCANEGSAASTTTSIPR